jgi:hypothetical protein
MGFGSVPKREVYDTYHSSLRQNVGLDQAGSRNLSASAASRTLIVAVTQHRFAFKLITVDQLRLYNCASVEYNAWMRIKFLGLIIRVDDELRNAFLEACRAQDKPAAQVLREFMSEYVNAYESL